MAEADEEAVARQWLAAFASRIGTATPTEEEFQALLALAAVAAHASHRTAAPVACWLAARAEVSPAEATAAARELGATPPG
ncbi:MAG: DUF6457 domain-containing protein [Acidimicrobiales bacterium]